MQVPAEQPRSISLQPIQALLQQVRPMMLVLVLVPVPVPVPVRLPAAPL